MQRLLDAVDRASTAIGHIFGWCIVALTLQVPYEVTVRYVLARPTSWGYDASYILYGLLFMMSGAYALARNGHVRGDFLYRRWSPRRQALTDLVLYVLFFFPGILALVVSGWDFFLQSWAQDERSPFSPDAPRIWPFKFLIPLVGVLLLVQGAAEVARCVLCLRTGAWPPRLHDAEELEVEILERVQSDRSGGDDLPPIGPEPGVGGARP